MTVTPTKLLLFIVSFLGIKWGGFTAALSGRQRAAQASDAWRSKGGFGTLATNEADIAMHGYLAASIPEALAHTGAAAFDDHLRGVQAVLRSWGADEAVQKAGLFHSIYGTEGFQGYKLPFARRPDIRTLIGERAERLAWIFCVVDRFTVDTTLDTDMRHFTSRDELARFTIELTDDEYWDFLELTLADWLEQVEGAAEKSNVLYGWGVGEAFSYRRKAYQRMAELLAQQRGPRLAAALQMSLEVYAQEGAATRHLHQVRTPPMSEAAKEARAALASVDQ